MKDENTRSLRDIAPELYKNCSYFECGDGWFVPLRELSCKLELINDVYRNSGYAIYAEQVKEKFGMLRFYFNVSFRENALSRLLNKLGLKTLAYRIACISRHDLKSHDIMYEMARANVRYCVDKCHEHCEICGNGIGTDASHRHMTTGYIQYICRGCAKKLGCESVDTHRSKHVKDNNDGQQTDCGTVSAKPEGGAEVLQEKTGVRSRDAPERAEGQLRTAVVQ